MTNKVLVTILFFVTCFTANAQKSKSGKGDEPDNKNMEKYLDDGRVGNVKNLVRLSIGRTVSSWAGASYEYRFTKNLALEGGAYFKYTKGYLWEEYRESIYALNYATNANSPQISNGLSFVIFPKFYTIGKYANYGRYFGLLTNLVNYKVKYEDAYTDDKLNVKASLLKFAFVVGSHKQFGSRFTFGYESGLGYFKETYKDVVEYYFDNNNVKQKYAPKDLSTQNLFLHFDVSIGILF